MSDISLIDRPAWKALKSHADAMHSKTIKQLFAEDSDRGTRLTTEACGLFLDYSKNRITDETIKLLVQLAEESGLRQRIEAMFTGEKINITENRAVLHVALRAPKAEQIFVDGEDVVPEVHKVLDKMSAFATVCGPAVAWPHGQAHEECHQYRDRWLRPWTGDGIRGAEALLRTRR